MLLNLLVSIHLKLIQDIFTLVQRQLAYLQNKLNFSYTITSVHFVKLEIPDR